MDRRDTFDVFYSYSHRDADLRGELDVHLALLKRQAVIRTWWDGEIQAGQEWSPEIFGRLEKADVILLLISPDFIASDFCWSKEMTRAMERHEAGTARVIPVLLRPVDNWQKAPFGKLQALPPGSKAVTEHANRDVALRDVAAGARSGASSKRCGAVILPGAPASLSLSSTNSAGIGRAGFPNATAWFTASTKRTSS
jgi:hypothetical protein